MSYVRALGLLLALGAGCAPMTFSKEESVDFHAYPSVGVEIGGPDGSERQRQYLEGELREHSGFHQVSPGREPASAYLAVDLTVSADSDLIEFLVDDDEELDIRYSAQVTYRLYAADGALLDVGSDYVEDEETSFSAAESALDLVVLHYLRPYRL